MKKINNYVLMTILGLIIGISFFYYGNKREDKLSGKEKVDYDIDFEYVEDDISKVDVYGIFSEKYYKYFVTDNFVKKIRRNELDVAIPDDYAVTKKDEKNIVK